jgi:hypothetical protein
VGRADKREGAWCTILAQLQLSGECVYNADVAPYLVYQLRLQCALNWRGELHALHSSAQGPLQHDLVHTSALCLIVFCYDLHCLAPIIALAPSILILFQVVV